MTEIKRVTPQGTVPNHEHPGWEQMRLDAKNQQKVIDRLTEVVRLANEVYEWGEIKCPTCNERTICEKCDVDKLCKALAQLKADGILEDEE